MSSFGSKSQCMIAITCSRKVEIGLRSGVFTVASYGGVRLVLSPIPDVAGYLAFCRVCLRWCYGLKIRKPGGRDLIKNPRYISTSDHEKYIDLYLKNSKCSSGNENTFTMAFQSRLGSLRRAGLQVAETPEKIGAYHAYSDRQNNV